MSAYRLDRTSFKAQIAETAPNAQAAYYKTLAWQERLRIANYLNSVAYVIPKIIRLNWIEQRSLCAQENKMGNIFNDD